MAAFFRFLTQKKNHLYPESGRDGFLLLFYLRILLLQWNLLDTTLVTTTLEGG